MRALLSVADRSGLPELARELVALGVELHATDGTREALAAEGVEAGSIADLTQTPPWSAARSRPSTRRSTPASWPDAIAPEHLEEPRGAGIGPIDIVVVNVRAVRAAGRCAASVPIDEAIAMIDVGGVALLLGGGAQLRRRGGGHRSRPLRAGRRGAARARGTSRPRPASGWPPRRSPWSRPTTRRSPPTSTTSAACASPSRLTLVLREAARPGLRREPAPARRVLPRDDPSRRHRSPTRTRLQGASPTFNDLLDLDAAYRIACRLHGPHRAHRQAASTRSGLASDDSPRRGLPPRPRERPGAAYGAVVGVNRVVDEATAEEPSAPASTRRSWRPGYADDARAILAGKPALPLLAIPATPTDGISDYGIADLDFHRIDGGVLVETHDRGGVRPLAAAASSPSAARRSRS